MCQGNLTARRYIDQTLHPVVVPMFCQHQGLVFQPDNARPQVAWVTKNLLQTSNIDMLPWRTCSPDCNPIEHAWNYLGQRLRKCQLQPANVQKLTAAIHQEWARIPRYLLRNLWGSMGRRLAAVVASRCGHTRYWLCQWNYSDQWIEIQDFKHKVTMKSCIINHQFY